MIKSKYPRYFCNLLDHSPRVVRVSYIPPLLDNRGNLSQTRNQKGGGGLDKVVNVRDGPRSIVDSNVWDELPMSVEPSFSVTPAG